MDWDYFAAKEVKVAICKIQGSEWRILPLAELIKKWLAGKRILMK